MPPTPLEIIATLTSSVEIFHNDSAIASTEPCTSAFNKIFNTCNDYMFSGHTVHVISFLLFILYFSKNIIEKIILICFAIFLLFIIINSRMHYTSDIIVAVIITFLLFNYLRLKFKLY